MKRQKFSDIDAIIIKRELEKLKGRKLKKIFQKKRDFLLLFDRGEKILISLDPVKYRIHLTERDPDSEESGFDKFLSGFVLVNVRVKKWDRLMYLIFSKDRGIRKLVLAVELTGKHANLILVSEDGKILDVYRKVPESEVRPVVPGLNYTPPPPRPFDPEKNIEKLAELIPWLTPPYGEKLYLALNETIALYCADKDIYSPVELECGAKKYFPSYSALLDFYFGRSESRDQEEKTALDRLVKELEKVRDFDLYRIAGEKVLLGEFEQDEDFIVVRVEGKEFRARKKEKPSDAAEEFFKKYKKFKRGYQTILKKLRTEGMDNGIGEKHDEGEGVSYEKFISPGGFVVYRGKNARGNEIVTFKIASPEDYFLHAENSPGSHVIIKTGKKPVSDSDLEFAARLALQKSKASKDLKGRVIVTLKKYLKRGDAPGQVLISKILKTVEVRLE